MKNKYALLEQLQETKQRYNVFNKKLNGSHQSFVRQLRYS